MNNDIVPELLEEIKKAFLSKSRESRILQDKLLALKNKKANYKDANEFAEELGEILADTFKENIKTENLPDGKMFYNIAQRIIDPNMHMTYDMVGDYSRDVQALLNQEVGISIAALKADINQDRIDKIVEKVSSYDSYDDGKWLLDEPMINFAQSIVDSTIKKNADFHYSLGFKPKIVRREVGGCCKWCKDKAGVYDYEEVKDTGNDVFRRHRFCRCTVDYVPDKSRRQDVWSKQWNNSDKRDKIEERILLSKQPNPISGGISGAISDTNSPEARKFAETEYGSIRKRKVDVKRIAKNTGYSEKQIEEIKKYLFVDKHDLGDGETRRFDPSFEIAQSWNRLMRGNAENHDLTLIKHEIFEKELISKGLSQEEAHKIASKKYNYRKESSEYYAKIKKRKKNK
ncbi:hypothetical protein [uncultured Anaerococcus sp.]|uniref:hypothetical protein n=1 Tax=uncultured Anaerococcus sp. TaxID=293428 RepID=UPI0028895F95|nr:hypothetical protein [uncultured Anaerococcus sp.]